MAALASKYEEWISANINGEFVTRPIPSLPVWDIAINEKSSTDVPDRLAELIDSLREDYPVVYIEDDAISVEDPEEENWKKAGRDLFIVPPDLPAVELLGHMYHGLIRIYPCYKMKDSRVYDYTKKGKTDNLVRFLLDNEIPVLIDVDAKFERVTVAVNPDLEVLIRPEEAFSEEFRNRYPDLANISARYIKDYSEKGFRTFVEFVNWYSLHCPDSQCESLVNDTRRFLDGGQDLDDEYVEVTGLDGFHEKLTGLINRIDFTRDRRSEQPGLLILAEEAIARHKTGINNFGLEVRIGEYESDDGIKIHFGLDMSRKYTDKYEASIYAFLYRKEDPPATAIPQASLIIPVYNDGVALNKGEIDSEVAKQVATIPSQLRKYKWLVIKDYSMLIGAGLLFLIVLVSAIIGTIRLFSR
ncbi:MAG TPA: hypothetical protein VGB30_03985 [bacterium]|jgi:hypothetical protein